MDKIGQILREQGWRQGIILPATGLLEGLPDGSPISDADFVMVVSQSCDLVHHDLSNEPHAVFLLLKKINSVESEYSHGRNPRLIHFPALDGSAFDAWAWNQVTIPREELVKHPIGNHLKVDARELRHILDWLAKRFTRVAFPDAFNEALRVKSNNIRTLLKKKHSLFSEILLRINPFEEIDNGVHYELACYLLMPSALYDDAAKLKDARETASKLERLFEDCGIEVLECSTVSDAELTYAELQELVRWDFDHLTHRNTSK